MTDRKKIFGIVNIALFALVLIAMGWYMNHGGLTNKAVSCASYVMLGGVNLAYALTERRAKGYPTMMFIGFVFAWLGDVLLGWNFIVGAGLFALGHVMYAVSFYMLTPGRRMDAVLSAIVFAGAAMLLVLYPKFDFGGPVMFAVCMAYALVISCMTGKAISNCLKERSALTAIAALGSILFFFSDVMLVLRFFADAPWIADRLCLATYFPGQGLLAASVCCYVRRK